MKSERLFGVELDKIISDKIINEIYESMGKYDYETGGLLGISDEIIDNFVFDMGITQKDSDIYIPNPEVFNPVIIQWENSGIKIAGLVHSHRNNGRLSYGDIYYGELIMKANNISSFFMPILNLRDRKICINKLVYDKTNDIPLLHCMSYKETLI